MDFVWNDLYIGKVTLGRALVMFVRFLMFSPWLPAADTYLSRLHSFISYLHFIEPKVTCNVFQFSSQAFVLQEDLKATEDEYEASRQVIEILQDQVEVLTRKKEVL